MHKTEKNSCTTHGYAQFLASKRILLAKYDAARVLDQAHKVQTYRGKVAEAEFRKWLQSFLPIKYGVTSGYIASQCRSKRDSPLPHYDVIIYDALECPILSVADNSDESKQGKLRVIPAEYVRAVFEVKSSLTLKSIRDANKKIKELDDLFFDPETDQNNPYNGKLHAHFFSANVFFDLLQKNFRNNQILDQMNPFRTGVKNHFTNLILRAEGIEDKYTGITKSPYLSDNSMIDFEKLVGFSMICDAPLSNGKYGGFSLLWNSSTFSDFAFSVLYKLNGTYNPQVIPSFYGLEFNF